MAAHAAPAAATPTARYLPSFESFDVSAIASAASSKVRSIKVRPTNLRVRSVEFSETPHRVRRYEGNFSRALTVRHTTCHRNSFLYDWENSQILEPSRIQTVITLISRRSCG